MYNNDGGFQSEKENIQHTTIMQNELSNLDVSHSQTVGVRGPVLVQDTVLHETLETFVFSTTLPRRLHTKGYGAFGYFYTTHSMKEYTKAEFLQTPNQQVPVAVRFSLASSNQGTPDTSRNVRGFSTKFYTEEGIFDLVGNNLPIFLYEMPSVYRISSAIFRPHR